MLESIKQCIIDSPGSVLALIAVLGALVYMFLPKKSGDDSGSSSNVSSSHSSESSNSNKQE